MKACWADLNENYNARQGKAWGFFHEESGAYPFSRWLNEYLQQSLSFIDFSLDAAVHLANLMEESNLTTGG
ncbi:hypothetical protein BVH06_00800 [Pseudomonas sp. PA27(2017)]|nr:hypothetical protein BVH06_00800 [Pseudomonas sp. PA27(2017)]